MMAGLVEALSKTWPARVGKSIIEAMTLPGDVYQGNVSMYGEDGRTNPEVINRAADLGGLVMGGSYAAAPAMRDGVGMGIRAYHGSPHSFDKFDLSKIGTGEGAQAYGHGLYFAEREGVAKSYRDALKGNASHALTEAEARLASTITDPNDLAFARQVIGEKLSSGANDSIDDVASYLLRASSAKPSNPALVTDALRDADALAMGKINSLGHMYEVNINADPAKMLDWDKPFSKQSTSVRDLVNDQVATANRKAQAVNFVPQGELGSRGSQITSSEFRKLQEKLDADPKWKGVWNEDRAWMHINDLFPKYQEGTRQQLADAIMAKTGGSKPGDLFVPPSATGRDLYSMLDNIHYGKPDALVSELRNAGLPGIKYLDQGSRGFAGAGGPKGSASSNYVVFDDSLIDILRKYGIAGLTGSSLLGAMAGKEDSL